MLVDFIGLNIFSFGGHLGFSTRLNFISLKPCSLDILYVEFENYGCSGFRDKVIETDLKARFDVNHTPAVKKVGYTGLHLSVIPSVRPFVIP